MEAATTPIPVGRRLRPRRCQHSLAMAIAFGVLAAGLGPLPALAGKPPADQRAGEVIVRIDPASTATIDVINAAYGTSTRRALPGELDAYLLAVPPGQSTADVVDELADDQRLLYAEPNYIAEQPEAARHTIYAWGGVDSEPFLHQYAAAMLGIDAAHTLSLGAGTMVAVIDGGVQLDHPALSAVLTSGFDWVDNDAVPADEGNGIDDDGDGIIDEGFGHGTLVTGIANLVAPAAHLMPLRVLDSEGRGTVYDTAEAIIFAINGGADVINLSMGAPTESSIVRDTIRDATSRGIVVVASAGNAGARMRLYPAAGSCALGVTALDATAAKPSFANYGGWIGFSAPGAEVMSTYPNNGYATGSGTSFAAPFLSGQAALISAVAPGLNVREMADVMAGTAISVDDVNPEYRGKLGEGRPDLLAGLQAAPNHSSQPSSNLISGSCLNAP